MVKKPTPQPTEKFDLIVRAQREAEEILKPLKPLAAEIAAAEKGLEEYRRLDVESLRVSGSKSFPPPLQVKVTVERAVESADTIVAGATDIVPAVCRFRQSGKRWEFVYDGIAQSSGHLVGYTFIAHLLRNPNTQFTPWQLIKSMEGIADNVKTMTLQSILGPDAYRKFQKAKEKLLADLETAQANHDQGNAARIRGEIRILIEQHKRDMKKKGGSRRFSDEREHARQNVHRAIKRALECIEDMHPQLYQHLHAAIHLKPNLEYIPGREIDWELEPL